METLEDRKNVWIKTIEYMIIEIENEDYLNSDEDIRALEITKELIQTRIK